MSKHLQFITSALDLQRLTRRQARELAELVAQQRVGEASALAALLPRLRSALLSKQAGEQQSGTSASRDAASELLRRLVAATASSLLNRGKEGVSDGADAEGHQRAFIRLLVPPPPTSGVLDIILSLLTHGEPEAIVATAAATLGIVARFAASDERIKSELLGSTSVMLKAIKQLVRKLGQLVQGAEHTHMLAGVVRGAMACLSALGGTTRSQCVSVEEACLHVLDSPHAQVRKAVAECFSLRPWCAGLGEWPILVGSILATIHSLLDSCYPKELASSFANATASSFDLPPRNTNASMAVELRLITLVTALRHCLAAPPTNERCVPVPIPHLIDLISRLLALSPLSPLFDSLDRNTQSLLVFLPDLHAHGYLLLSSLIVCAGRHLLPHYTTIWQLITRGLERSTQLNGQSWMRTLHHLLESTAFALPVLAPCLWKEGAPAILSFVLPLVSQHHASHDSAAAKANIRLSALRVIGAVVRHAGAMLPSLQTVELHRALLVVSTTTLEEASYAFQEKARRVLAECCLLPQAAPLLPHSLHLLQGAALHSAAAGSGIAAGEVLIHPRMLPRVRLAPPPLPDAATALAAAPLVTPTPTSPSLRQASLHENSPARKRAEMEEFSSPEAESIVPSSNQLPHQVSPDRLAFPREREKDEREGNGEKDEQMADYDLAPPLKRPHLETGMMAAPAPVALASPVPPEATIAGVTEEFLKLGTSLPIPTSGEVDIDIVPDEPDSSDEMEEEGEEEEEDDDE